MVCPQCGRLLPGGDQNFCAHCGARLPALQQDSIRSAMSFEPASRSQGGAASLAFDLSVPSVPSTPIAAPAPPEEEPSSTAGKKGAFGALAALVILIWKFKAVAIAVLLKLKSVLVLLKFGKIFTTMSTMLLSIAVYGQLWGWKLAAALMVLTLVHEMGHVLVAWRKKLPVTAPMFIPFIGAVIVWKKNPKDALTESHVGYGGPALGAVGDTVAWGLFYVTGNPLLLAASNVSMMWNLFNLTPLSPLDGGRIVAAISPKIWLAGLVFMGVWFLLTHSPIMLIILILGGVRLAAQWKTMKTDEYFKVPAHARIEMTVLYIGLALYLAGCHAYTHGLLMDWIRARGI